MAGIAVRHPLVVAMGRHYGLQVATCVPYDPESKGGSVAMVRMAKADLVPAEAKLLADYRFFGELTAAVSVSSAWQRTPRCARRNWPG